MFVHAATEINNQAETRAGPALPAIPGNLPGGGDEGSTAAAGAKMIFGTFQAVVMPFDPSFIGAIAAGKPPQLPGGVAIPGTGG